MEFELSLVVHAYIIQFLFFGGSIITVYAKVLVGSSGLPFIAWVLQVTAEQVTAERVTAG